MWDDADRTSAALSHLVRIREVLQIPWSRTTTKYLPIYAGGMEFGLACAEVLCTTLNYRHIKHTAMGVMEKFTKNCETTFSCSPNFLSILLGIICCGGGK